MITTIKIYHEQDISCDILYGTPIARENRSGRRSAIFEENSLVIYSISKARKQLAYLFRTGSKGCDSVPGVYPSVLLLSEATSKEKVSRLLAIFTSLSRRNIDASKLDNSFFIRLNTIIDNRTFRIRDAINMLKHEN